MYNQVTARLSNENSAQILSHLVRAFFKIQEIFTHIVEVDHPELDSNLYAM